jgi:hypothetical protein
MLSSRGQEYAKSGLYGQYGRDKKEPYDKTTNPNGEVDFGNAENVGPAFLLIYCILLTSVSVSDAQKIGRVPQQPCN